MTYDKLFYMQVHNSYPLNFLFTCKKLLPDDQSPIMLSETFLLKIVDIPSLTLSLALLDLDQISLEWKFECSLNFSIA